MEKKHVVIGTRLSPTCRPGRDILLRVGGYSPSQIVRRDLARYYDLVSSTLKSIKGRFKIEELEALADAMEGLLRIGRNEPIYRAPMLIQEAVQHGEICETYGIEDCEEFMEKIEGLKPVDTYALVDAIGRYLTHREGKGEEGWKRVGLL